MIWFVHSCLTPVWCIWLRCGDIFFLHHHPTSDRNRIRCMTVCGIDSQSSFLLCTLHAVKVCEGQISNLHLAQLFAHSFCTEAASATNALAFVISNRHEVSSCWIVFVLLSSHLLPSVCDLRWPYCIRLCMQLRMILSSRCTVYQCTIFS